MKRTKKLEIKKVTLKNLDEPTLNAIAGGSGVITCVGKTCSTCPRTCLCQ
jgi:hypothetical protein